MLICEGQVFTRHIATHPLKLWRWITCFLFATTWIQVTQFNRTDWHTTVSYMINRRRRISSEEDMSSRNTEFWNYCWNYECKRQRQRVPTAATDEVPSPQTVKGLSFAEKLISEPDFPKFLEVELLTKLGRWSSVNTGYKKLIEKKLVRFLSILMCSSA